MQGQSFSIGLNRILLCDTGHLSKMLTLNLKVILPLVSLNQRKLYTGEGDGTACAGVNQLDFDFKR